MYVLAKLENKTTVSALHNEPSTHAHKHMCMYMYIHDMCTCALYSMYMHSLLSSFLPVSPSFLLVNCMASAPPQARAAQWMFSVSSPPTPQRPTTQCGRACAATWPPSTGSSHTHTTTTPSGPLPRSCSISQWSYWAGMPGTPTVSWGGGERKYMYMSMYTVFTYMYMYTLCMSPGIASCTKGDW